MRIRLMALIFFVALAAVSVPMVRETSAQPVSKVPRIGFLSGEATPTASDWKQASPSYLALRELGWEDGNTITLEYRWADGHLEHLPDLAAELVRLNVDVIVASAFKPGLVAAQTTSTIPVVLVTCDPYQWIVGSLARPGSNVTGQTCMSAELAPKKLEYLKQAVPTMSRIAFVYNPDDPGPSLARQLCEAAARDLSVQLVPIPIQNPDETDRVLTRIAKERVDALFVYPDSVTTRVRGRFITFANQRRLPSMYGFAPWVRDGGLMSYGASLPDMSRRAMSQVDKILRGVKPADLPIEQPTKFDLVINLKTAKAIGLTIPQSLLTRADELIE